MQGRLTEFCILFLCPLDGEQFKDLLWVMGSQEMAGKLLRLGLLD